MSRYITLVTGQARSGYPEGCGMADFFGFRTCHRQGNGNLPGTGCIQRPGSSLAIAGRHLRMGVAAMMTISGGVDDLVGPQSFHPAVWRRAFAAMVGCQRQ